MISRISLKNKHGILLSTILTIAVLTISLPGDAEASHPKKVKNLTGVEGDESVTLSWDRPTGKSIPQDYVISYKLTTASSWSIVSDGVNTRTTAEVEDLVNNVSYDFKVAAKKLDNHRLRYSDTITLVPYSTTTTTSTETDKCFQPGADNVESKCYAVVDLAIHNTVEDTNGDTVADKIRGFYGTINVDDVNVQKGFNAAAYWLKFTSYEDPTDRRNDRTPILELGIIDQSGNRSHPKFYCAEDGDMQSRQWSASADRDYPFKIFKKSTSSTGVTWGLTVNGNTCSDITVPNGTVPVLLERGTETSYNSSPDFTQEFDTMAFKWTNNKWYYVQSYFGIDSFPSVATGYFVDPCGRNNSMENFYHIETGKGVRSNC